MLSALALTLSACVSTKTQVVVGDQEYAMSRTAPERVVDFGLQRDIIRYVEQINGVENGNHRVAVNAFRTDVLLTGEVPTQAIKDEIGQIVRSIRQVGKIYNYLKISPPKSQSHTFQEQYMKGKIDAKLLLKQSQNITPSQYSVIVRDDWAYVFGVMTVAQQEELIKAIESVDGVRGLSLLNSLVQADFTGLESKVSNMPGDLNSVNPNNRLIPIPTVPQPKVDDKKGETPSADPSNNSSQNDKKEPFAIIDDKAKSATNTAKNASTKTATKTTTKAAEVTKKSEQTTQTKKTANEASVNPQKWTGDVPILHPATQTQSANPHQIAPPVNYGQNNPTIPNQSGYVQLYGGTIAP